MLPHLWQQLWTHSMKTLSKNLEWYASGIVGTDATKKNTTKGSQTSKMDESNSDKDEEGKDKNEDENYEDDNSTNLGHGTVKWQ